MMTPTQKTAPALDDEATLFYRRNLLAQLNAAGTNAMRVNQMIVHLITAGFPDTTPAQCEQVLTELVNEGDVGTRAAPGNGVLKAYFIKDQGRATLRSL